MIKIGKVLLIALSVSVGSSYGADYLTRAKNSWSGTSFAEKALMIGAPTTLIAMAYGLYRLITAEESNQAMHDRIDHLQLTMFNHYKDALHGEFVHYSTEADLMKCVEYGPNFDLKFHDIASDLLKLNAAKNILEARYKREKAVNNTAPVMTDMEDLLVRIKSLIKNLEPINTFWQEHKQFFRATRELNNNITFSYKKIMEHAHDTNFIKRIIMSHTLTVGLQRIDYPYIYYVTRLNNDIKSLTIHKQKVARYPLLHGRISLFICDLQDLLDTIAAMPEYMADKERKQQYELEQERIAVERQKAEAERAKVAAMERQAAAERAKANAMYAQAAADREKAQAIKEQTLFNLAQQQKPQVVTINVQSPAQASPIVEKPAVQPHKPSEINKPTEIVPPFTPAVPSAPADDTDTTKLFEAIENISPSAISRLDFIMPQLEQRYGSADKAIINGHSLISAAIYAKNLDTFNKADLIAWLKNYGIRLTSADVQAARQTNDQAIINAAGA